MAIYDFFLSRNGAASTPENYIGHAGRLFYDDATGEIRISDGATAGGLPIAITVATDATVGGVRPGAGLSVDGAGILTVGAGPSFFFDGDDLLRLRPGSADLIGGIKAGPGVVIDSEGTLFIDSEGLEFSFGDFTAEVGTYTDSTEYALLSSVKADEDIVIASNGTGTVCVVGSFHVHGTNGTVTGSLEDAEPVFQVLQDGQIRMLVPLADTTAGALEIIGNDAGTKFSPNQTGVILHVTGNSGLPCRNYFDADDNYALLVGRRLNGSIESPTGVLSGDVLLRIAAQGLLGDDGGGYTAGESLDFGLFGVGRTEWVATEDQFFGAQGGEYRVWATPNGSPGTNPVKVATFNATTGITSDVGFVGNLTGNASTVTNGVYTTDTGTVTNTMLAGSIANDKLANSTISGVALGSDLAALSAGNYLTGTDYTGATARTFAVDATTTNTASKVVARDASGNFAAGTITANLNGNVTGNVSGSAGSVANALTAGTYLTSGGTYNGGTARTFAVDATTTATASKVVARDSNGTIAATNTKFATREAGSFGTGQTITINMATDYYVHASITSETVTVAYTNITAGRQIYLLVTNASGGDLELNSGIATTRMTNAKAIENMKNGGTSRLGVISFGTTVADLYGNFQK